VPEDTLFAFGSLRLSDWQALVLAAFASFGAPLGGILASGAKRAVDLKDFGKLVPGHGGVMDRVDCQLFMSAFSYLFLSSSSLAQAAAVAAGAGAGKG
jgi:phosphatidate cytidylyltransferase